MLMEMMRKITKETLDHQTETVAIREDVMTMEIIERVARTKTLINDEQHFT